MGPFDDLPSVTTVFDDLPSAKDAQKLRLKQQMREAAAFSVPIKPDSPFSVSDTLNQAGIGITQGLADYASTLNQAASLAVSPFSTTARDFFEDRARAAQLMSQELEQIGEAEPGSNFARTMGSGIMSMLPSITPLGLPGGIAVGGAQSALSTMREAQDAFEAKGVSRDEARRKSFAPALAAGLVTALVTKVGGKTGAEALADMVRTGGWKSFAKEVGKQGGFEASEEFYDQLGQSAIARLTYNPEMTIEQALQESATAGTVGGILGGGIGAIATRPQRGQRPPPAAPQPDSIPLVDIPQKGEVLEFEGPAGEKIQFDPGNMEVAQAMDYVLRRNPDATFVRSYPKPTIEEVAESAVEAAAVEQPLTAAAVSEIENQIKSEEVIPSAQEVQKEGEEVAPVEPLPTPAGAPITETTGVEPVPNAEPAAPTAGVGTLTEAADWTAEAFAEDSRPVEKDAVARTQLPPEPAPVPAPAQSIEAAPVQPAPMTEQVEKPVEAAKELVKSEAVKAEVVTPETVKQSKPPNLKAARDQKSYLLEQIDVAIKAAPETLVGPNVEEPALADKSTFEELKKQSNEGKPTYREWEGNRRRSNEEIKEDWKAWDTEWEPKFEELFSKYGIAKSYPRATQKVLSGEDRVLREGGDETFSSRLEQLEAAIASDIRNKSEHVVISIPGDGVFSILNTKAALADFKERAKKFPTTTARAYQPGLSKKTATPIPEVATPTRDNVVKALKPFLSTNENRKVITFSWSDGKQSVATDGLRMIIIKKGIGGTTKKPQVSTPDGKPVADHSEYPNWKQVEPENSETVFKNIDTGRLFQVLIQANEAADPENPWMVLLRNPDGTLAIASKHVGVASYQHNLQPGAKRIASLDPIFVADAMRSMRAIGDKSVDIGTVFVGEDPKTAESGLSPVVFESRNAKVIIMPGRDVGGSEYGVLERGDIEPKPDSIDSALTRAIDSLSVTGASYSDPFLIQTLGRPIAKVFLYVVRASYRAGRTLARSIANGIRWLQRNHPNLKFNRQNIVNAVQNVAAQPTHLSPKVDVEVRLIDSKAEKTNVAPEPRVNPDASPRRFEAWRNVSGKIKYFGSESLLRAKQLLDLRSAYQSSAVKKQSDALMDRLFSDTYDAQTGWKLPKWMMQGAWATRAREFKKRVLHIASRLNATGRNPDGTFAFTDFNVRVGSMTKAAFKAGKHNVGDIITVTDPDTGLTEEFRIGDWVETKDGRAGYQLWLDMKASEQAELYAEYATRYPEIIWLLDMFIDPALANARETHNGVEIPVFNRFASSAMMAANDPNFTPLTGYTPDVLVTRSLIGAIRGALSFQAGTRSSGRKYKFGRSREGGHVRDLLSGFNIRTFQMLQENARREWRQAILKAATPIPKGGVPEGWVQINTGMQDMWNAVKRLRNWTSPVDPKTNQPIFPETEQRLTDDGSKEYKDFFGEAAALRGKQLMLPKVLVDALIKQHAVHVEHNALWKLGAWAVRNSTQLFLAMPKTYMANVLTNDLFATEAAYRYAIAGLLSGDMQKIGFARRILSGLMTNRFVGLRQMLGFNDKTQFMQAVNQVLPDKVFADSTSLADVKVRFGDTPMELLRKGELGGAVLQMIQYGNIDVRAKQRIAFAFLKSMAVANAKAQGLSGKALKQEVDNYLKNPPEADRVRAVEIANFEMLNYADTPDIIAEAMRRNDFYRLILPFPRFGYHYLSKQATRVAALKDLLGKVPPSKRADAFADLVTVGTFGLGGGGLVLYGLASLLGGDDDDAREFVGASTVPVVNEDGTVTYRDIDRTQITSNRINLSHWARVTGLGGQGEDDWWLRVRNYPVIAMAGAVALAYNDTKKYGVAAGARALGSATADLASDFFSVGAGLKIPSKIWAEYQSVGRSQKQMSPLDPYATHVPLSMYVTEQLVDSFIPGTRQADELITWIDPTVRRRTSSKTLDYDPGIVEGFKIGNWTGLLDRLVRGGESDLPPAGTINRKTGEIDEPRVISLDSRMSSLAGFNLRKLNRERYEEEIKGE